jgi:hypothetical protein
MLRDAVQDKISGTAPLSALMPIFNARWRSSFQFCCPFSV